MNFNKVKLYGSLLLLVLIFIFLPNLSIAGPLDVWHWRNPLPQGNDLYGITYGNGLFVAVGNKGTILTSSNSVNWTAEYSELTTPLYGVAFGNGKFTAVGAGGTVITSPDGMIWGPGNSGTEFDLYGVTFGKGIFVAVGSNHAINYTILSSFDGVTWSERKRGDYGPGVYGSSPLSRLNAVAFGNDIFVAAGDPASLIITSPDGEEWTETPGTLYSAGDRVNGIAYGNGTFIAAGNIYANPGAAVLISSDGVMWNQQKTNDYGPNGITYGDGRFVTVGGGYYSQYSERYGTYYRTIGILPAGQIWSSERRDVPYVLNAVAYGSGTFVAVGTSGMILTSSDGVDWLEQTSIMTYELNAVARGNGTFVAVGGGKLPSGDYYSTILTSPDGTNWADKSSGNLWVKTAVFGNDTFVLEGVNSDGCEIHSSTDGVNWAVRLHCGSIFGIEYGNGIFVALDSGGILISPDGVSWTTSPVPSLLIGYKINTFNFWDGVFTVTARHCWLVCDPPIPNLPDPIPPICHEVCTYKVFTTPDGMNWAEVPLLTPSGGFKSVAITDGAIVAVSKPYYLDPYGVERSSIYTSPDGVGTWTTRHTGVSKALKGVAFGNNTFVIVGDGGTILQSDAIIFSDLAMGHWAESQIVSLYDSGITAGCGNGNFCPDDPVTRGQMAVFIEASLGQANPPTCTGTIFSDVNDQAVGAEFCGFIEDFAVRGITRGCQTDNPDTPAINEARYCPDDPITRAQMAVFIEAAIGGGTPSPCTETLFSDVTNLSVGPAFCDYIEKLASDGITGGCGNGNFCPDKPVTRAEMAVFLVAALPSMKRFCGGFGNFPCPEGLVCVDVPNDDCDPNAGGADCPGMCVINR